MTTSSELVKRIIIAAAKYEFNYDLHWNESARFFINCDFVFLEWDGDHDEVEVTEESLPVLIQAMLDCPKYGLQLFCARMKAVCPTGQFRREHDFDDNIAKMFEECGPEREIDHNNLTSWEPDESWIPY